MATQNLWGISNVQRNVRPGWTASSISHNEDLHKSAQGMLGVSPAQKQALDAITGKILGINIKAGPVPPPGTTTGMAQNLGNAGIPGAVSSAIGNLQTNINANTTNDILQKFLAAISRPSIVAVNATTPAMDEYYRNKNVIMEAPAQIQTNINRLTTAADKLQPTGTMSIVPFTPGAYEGSVTQKLDQQLMQGVIDRNKAQRAAQSTGWLPYMPQY